MDRRLLGVVAAVVAVVIVSVALTVQDLDAPVVQKAGKIGLVINTPNQSVSLQQVDKTYSDASSIGIGRSNVYMFWNLVEPDRGKFDWSQYDVLMGLNKKNNLNVTLFFSVINGHMLGPFPDWIGNPHINSIGEERLADVLDAVLSRYDIIDIVIIGGETESQFRHHEQNIPVYRELFSEVYERVKEKHPDVKIGNSFGFHHVLNKELSHIVGNLTVGDFVAFSYSPVDILNDIVRTPQEAVEDLGQVFELVPGKVGFFEVSWSTSDFVGGDADSQRLFVEKLFEFYSENESEIEFMTWYRQHDRPDGTCAARHQDIGDESVTVGSSGLGGNQYVIERLGHYICSAGLVSVDGSVKPGWSEFARQIEMLR